MIYVCHITNAKGKTLSRTRYNDDEGAPKELKIFFDGGQTERIVFVHKNGNRINWTREER